MRKYLFLLPVLLFVFSPVQGYYDDFTGYESFYKVIDPCNNVTTSSTVVSAAGTDTSNITVDAVQFRDGGTSIRWDKTGGTNSTTQVIRSGIASINMSLLTTGSLQFWYYLPSFGALWNRATANISSDSTFSIGGNNTTVSTSVPVGSSLATNTWNYFKVSLLSWPLSVDSTAISAWSVEFFTPTGGATCTAIRIDDLRVVSASNTTNGVWNEDSGVWSIYNNGGTKVYRQNGNCDIAKPQLLLNKFKSDDFQELLDKYNIVSDMNVVGDHNALGIIDNFAKRLKMALSKKFIRSKSTNWIDSLQKIIDNYNNQENSAIDDIAPNEAHLEENQSNIFEINLIKGQMNKTVSDLKEGDHVRIKIKGKFSKGSDAQWSDNVYEVKKVRGGNIELDDAEIKKRGNLLKVVAPLSKSDNVISESKRDAKVERKLKSEGVVRNDNIESVFEATKNRDRKKKVIMDL